MTATTTRGPAASRPTARRCTSPAAPTTPTIPAMPRYTPASAAMPRGASPSCCRLPRTPSPAMPIPPSRPTADGSTSPATCPADWAVSTSGASPSPSTGLGGVENLGEPINTEGDEMFPTFRPNGDLYFSSDGHVGMGGLDLFRAKRDPPPPVDGGEPAVPHELQRRRLRHDLRGPAQPRLLLHQPGRCPRMGPHHVVRASRGDTDRQGMGL